jgi:biotin-dependent carboxylase-like uncharacterized protein
MIKVLNPGLASSIQDCGRIGYSEFGVPISGALDMYSAELSNSLLGNSNNAAVLEATMVGPTLQFYCDTAICVTGANMSPELNGKPIKMNSAVVIPNNSILKLGRVQEGVRSYLAVSGGFQTKEVMKSRSMYPNITSKALISKNDILLISENSQEFNKNASIRIKKNHFNEESIEVYKGPEFEFLSDKNKEYLFSTNYTVSNKSNRMAYQLEESLPNNLQPIITSMVMPGTIQLTPSGQLIILMRDCQTTGGYPRILQLKESSINVLAQKIAGKVMNFELIN